MLTYLSFGEIASRLGCETKKVRQLVLEDKSLRATRITPNGLVLTGCGLNGHFPYDLDFNSHLSSDGEITCDTYRLNAKGETEKTQTLFVGYLRVESAELQRFLSEKTPFTNDDDTLDDAALPGLATRGADAAQLVRQVLGVRGDKSAFRILPRSLEVPAALLALDSDTAVTALRHWFDFSIEETTNAGQLKSEIEQRIKDQAAGLFSIDEAACIAADAIEDH